MLISTFELLLKSQLTQEVRNLSCNVTQDYFLTIANLSSFDLVLSLVFTTPFFYQARSVNRQLCKTFEREKYVAYTSCLCYSLFNALVSISS